MAFVGSRWVRRNLHGLLLVAGMAVLGALFRADVAKSLALAGAAPVSTPAVQMAPVTQDSDTMDGFGAWSPDGKQIAFMRDGEIWLALPQPHRLTSQRGAWDAVPVWLSGDRLAFLRLAVGDGSSRVMVRTLSTGKEVELAREPEQIGYLAASPGGKDLVYTTKTRVMKLENLQRKRTLLATAEPVDLIPGGVAYAPDGKRLVLGFGRKGDLDLHEMPAAGGRLRRLTQEGGIMPTLSPDGKLLVYRRPQGESGIWVINLQTGDRRLLLPDTRKALWFHPEFAPGGEQLVVSRLNAGRPGRFTSDLIRVRMKQEGDGQ